MAQTFNVFLSNELLQLSSSGYLTGCVSLSSGLICVLGMTPHVVNTQERVIGYWSHTQTSKVKETYLNALQARGQCLEKDESSCIMLLQSDSFNNMTCEIFVSYHGITQEARAVLILFKPQDVLQSYIFMKEQQVEYGKQFQRNKETCLKNFMCHYSLGAQVADMINTFSQSSPLPQEVIPYKKESFLVGTNRLKKIIWELSQLFLWNLSCFWKLSSRRIVTKLFSYLNVFQLLYDKSQRCHKIATHHKGLVFNQFITYNICAQHVGDSLAGVLILYLILHFGFTNIIASSTLDWADDVAARLKNLTHWLMGAPAGLKLNAELTNFFGHFYIYHIYVWTGIDFVLRILGAIENCIALAYRIWCVVWSFGIFIPVVFHSGCFSFTDLTYLLLLCVCGKVYALGSLWKLFRGKKWNVLRCRVDSAEYNTDQLFVGTLMFTVLLFLLPTTVLYYIVFTSLYAVILSVQGLLTNIITFINDLPIHTLILRILKPKLIAAVSAAPQIIIKGWKILHYGKLFVVHIDFADAVIKFGATFFRIVNSSTDSSILILIMETSQLPLNDVINLTAPYLRGRRRPKYTWGKLLSNIATGQLIYPWMDAPSKEI